MECCALLVLDCCLSSVGVHDDAYFPSEDGEPPRYFHCTPFRLCRAFGFGCWMSTDIVWWNEARQTSSRFMPVVYRIAPPHETDRTNFNSILTMINGAVRCAPPALRDISFFSSLHAPSRRWMEQGVKLLNNRNLYHLDDFKSITFFSLLLRCAVFSEGEGNCCWIILCVVFECADYSRVRCFSPPVNFVFTSLGSPRCFCFFFSWACLLCCFFTRYENNLPCLEVKVTKFSRVPSRFRRAGIVLTAATTFSQGELGQSKFSPIHWAIIYWDEFQRATE